MKWHDGVSQIFAGQKRRCPECHGSWNIITIEDGFTNRDLTMKDIEGLRCKCEGCEHEDNIFSWFSGPSCNIILESLERFFGLPLKDIDKYLRDQTDNNLRSIFG